MSAEGRPIIVQKCKETLKTLPTAPLVVKLTLLPKPHLWPLLSYYLPTQPSFVQYNLRSSVKLKYQIFETKEPEALAQHLHLLPMFI